MKDMKTRTTMDYKVQIFRKDFIKKAARVRWM